MKEFKIFILHQQQLTLRLFDGKVIEGIPEAVTDRVKLRNDTDVVFVPLEDIKHVSWLLQLERKKDPTNTLKCTL